MATLTRLLTVVFVVTMPLALFDVAGEPVAWCMLLSGAGALALAAQQVYRKDAS